MQYTSPLHLLSDRDASEIDAANLKKWRKELLLRFELENSTTIQMAGKEYDKNEVLAALESLKEVSDFHFIVFKNKPLLAFLEKGDTAFFQHHQNWLPFRETDFVEQVRPYFLPQYSRIINKLVQQPRLDSVNQLKMVLQSGFPLPKSYQDEAFAGAHSLLTLMTFRAKVALHNPYQQGTFLLKKEATELFNLHYIQVFDLLPSSFSGIKMSYAILANNFVYEALNQSTNHPNLPKQTLRLLIDASKINQHFRPDAQTVRLIRQLQDMLNAKPSSSGGGNSGGSGDSGGSGFQVVWLVICLFVFIIRLATVADGCEKNRSKNYNNYNQYSLERYYYSPKTSIKAKKELNLPIEKANLLGKWASTKWVDNTRNIQETIDFFTESVGRFSYLVYEIDSTFAPGNKLDVANKKVICEYQGYFIWTVTNGIYNNVIQFEMKDLSLNGCKNKSLTTVEQKALTSITAKLEQDIDTRRVFNKKNEALLAFEGIWFEKIAGVDKNWKKELKKHAPELSEYVAIQAKLTKISDAIAAKFVKATKATNLDRMPQFFISPQDNSFVFKGRVKEIPMADGIFDKGKYYIRPNLWVAADTTLFSIGQFKNIDFIDNNGKKRRGNLKAFQTTDEGFLFGEVR